MLNLARVHADLEFLRLLNWKVAWTSAEGRVDVADASSIKVFGTEAYLRCFRLPHDLGYWFVAHRRLR